MTFAERYEKMMDEIYAEVDKMLVCPECGDGLGYDPDSGKWECYDCYCHNAAGKWEYTIDELHDILEETER